jgi:hypothetical protein
MDDEFAANYMERAVSPQAPKRWLWARVADASPTPQFQHWARARSHARPRLLLAHSDRLVSLNQYASLSGGIGS